MKRLKTIAMILGMFSASFAQAACDFCNDKPWTIDAALGAAFYQDTGKSDAQGTIGRLSIGYTFINQAFFMLGLEGGVQNGNHLRLVFPKSDISTLGGVPIDAEIKPIMDIMLSLKTESIGETPLYLWGKFGGAYRQLRLDRESVNSVKSFSPEVMAGLGWHINKQVAFTLGYQYINGDKPTLSVNSNTETGVLRNIPAQQAVLAGFSFNFL